MGSIKYKGRKILNFSIKRKFQFQMITRITLILFFSLLISSATYYYFANQEITSSWRLFHIDARNFLDFLLPIVIGSFFVSLVTGIIVSLFFPKSIAGSLYRIEQDVKRITDGDLTVQINLRAGDPLPSLAESINTLVSTLRNKMSTIQSILEQMNAVYSSEEIPNESRDALQRIYKDICCEISSLRLD